MLRVGQVGAMKFGLFVLRAGLCISVPGFPDGELVLSLESGLVTLLTCDDLEVITRFWRLLGLVHLDVVNQRIVAIRMSIWVWLAVLQVCK